MKNLQKTDTSTLSNMIQFYESSQVNCQCGQNKLEMANFKINIPCIHQIALGAEFEDLPEIKLTLYNQYENLTIEYLFSQNLNLPPQNFDEKQYVIRTIKHFSRYKNEDSIREFVDLHNDASSEFFFINNQPVSQIQLIEEGIYHFKQLKANQK